MAGPTVMDDEEADSEEPDEGDEPVDGFAGGFDDVEDDEDFTVGEVDLGIDDDDGVVAGFDGFDDDTADEGAGNASSSDPKGSPTGDAISDAIEDGLAEIAVVGLQGSERKRVRNEMQAIASQFKVGYFGEQCVQKYLKTDLENIPPEYGLAASMVAFFAIALYKRPDGEQRIRMAVSTMRARFQSDDPEPTPDEGDDDTEEDDDE